MQAYGWGNTKFRGNLSDVLLETNLTVVTTEVCQKMFCKRMAMRNEDEYEYDSSECANNLKDGMLCAGSLGKRRKSVCFVSTLVEKLPSFLHSIIIKRKYLIIMSIPIHI